MAGYPRKTSAESVISYLNVENAKLLALVLVIGFIGYHGILHLRYGPDSCTWLLSSGRYKGDHEWQPYGCMLHRYSKTDTLYRQGDQFLCDEDYFTHFDAINSDARRCMRYLAFWGKHNSFVFIGDARMQQLYEYFIDVLRTRLETDKSYSMVDQHLNNFTYIASKLHLSVKFILTTDVSSKMVQSFVSWQKSDKPPSLIVAGTGLELIRKRNSTQLVLEEYKTNLTRIVQSIDWLAKRNTSVLWRLIEPIDVGKSEFYKAVTNKDIDVYNKAAVEILTHSSAKIFNAPRLIVTNGLSPDGVTLSNIALRYIAQILLNMYCNDHMNYNDGTCCAQPETRTHTQFVTILAFVLVTIIAVIKSSYQYMQTLKKKVTGYVLVQEQKTKPSIMVNLAKLGMIMAYFYLCDRTNFFMKENKYYSEWSFWLPVGYVFALGLFFTEDSRYNRVLHRDQSNEWKGWMQAVILIYQVTGASKILPIYMIVRSMVSSYLFFTGYGHFYYLWNNGDTSLVRYFRVMFRLNFLTVVLCLTMNRPYQFYSFVPLVSFWYTLVFVIFALPPHLIPASTHTTESKPYQYLYIAMKIIGLLAIVTVLFMSEVFFQKIFVTRPWKALFVNSDDDIRQWWLRWKQDRYSMAYGIMLSVGYLLAQRYNFIDDSSYNNLFTPGLALTSALLALTGIGSYVTFTFFCKNISDCNEIHSYATFVPIVSYLILRNVSGALRTRYSSMFAWLGTFTLELFVSQSHIWLAADTHGVLVLIPGAPVLNLILTTYIFVCTAHELNKLTAAIQNYAVPDDWRLVLRNVGVFLGVLIPIGIHDGMF